MGKNRRAQEQMKLADGVERWLESNLDKNKLTLAIIDEAEERLKPAQRMFDALRTFASTDGMPDGATQRLGESLREVLDYISLTHSHLKAMAMRNLGASEGLLEDSEEGWKPKGRTKVPGKYGWDTEWKNEENLT